ncbi:MAG: methyltransferase domain-containing protein, partial [Desulfosalsimonadaceae bacterium]|nr:methyltransferase domain-containing protein [Desulfosalsimonadaceae bacterium]
ITSRKSGVAVGEYELVLSGDRCLKERLGRFEFEVSANSFFQTNTRGAAVLYDTVKKYAGLSGTENVLDLYSGTGTIPIWLADGASEITGIEIVESAVADAHENCRRNGVSNCRFLVGDIREKMASITHKPDVLIIDPPGPECTRTLSNRCWPWPRNGLFMFPAIPQPWQGTRH